MTTPVPDKRKGKPRVQKRLPVRFGTEAKMRGGTVLDISEGGMRIESPDTFPVHSLLTVFVQFPRHSVRLRARIVWSSASDSGPTVMGLALTQPEPTLRQAFAEWVAEVKKAVADEHASGGPAAASAATPGTAPAAPRAEGSAPTPAPAPAPPSQAAGPRPPEPQAGKPQMPEPTGPVRRRLESRQGESYDALLERQPDGWQLTIVQAGRQAGAPNLETTCPDYATAEKALREFVRTH